MRRLKTDLLLILVALAGIAAARADDSADLRILPGTDSAAWVGEKVDVYLELWTRDLSFSDQAFVLPQVRGGYLMQPDSTTVKLNDRRNGEAWQGLRYYLALYSQRAGDIEIPSFEVRFSTSAGYGSMPKAHTLRTQPLTVRALLPPGADSNGLLVSTSLFRLRAGWEPVPLDDGTLELKTGDALVLNVQREAEDVPGMVFAPLPEYSSDGLGVYTDSPTVDDRVNRGRLTGVRTDRVTLVCERPGRYELPELRFQWWDAEKEQMNEEFIPALTLEVVQNPAWAVATVGRDSGGGARVDKRWLWLLPAALLIWWPVRPLIRALSAWLAKALRARRLEPLNPRSSRSS